MIDDLIAEMTIRETARRMMLSPLKVTTSQRKATRDKLALPTIDSDAELDAIHPG